MTQHQPYYRTAVLIGRQHLVNQFTSIVVLGVDDALFNHIRSKLLLRQGEKLTTDFGDDERSIGSIPLLDDPLNDVLKGIITT